MARVLPGRFPVASIMTSRRSRHHGQSHRMVRAKGENMSGDPDAADGFVSRLHIGVESAVPLATYNSL
jgi:hypothetical protein